MYSSLKKESRLLAKHSFIYGLGTVLNQVAAFLLLPIYTRFLTPHDYGLKELVGLTTEVVGILLATAISSAFYRFYFEYKDEKNRKEVVSSAIIVLSIVGLLALLVLSFFSKIMAKYILDSADFYYFFLIAFTTVWFQSLNGIGYNYLQARQRSLAFVSLSMLKLILAIGINIYLVCILKIGVLGILISTLITSIIMWSVLIVPLFIKVGFHFSLDKIKEMLKFGFPLIPAQIGAFVVHLSDRFFLKGYCSIADVGLYSLGYRFGALPGNFISVPFNRTWQPRRFELHKEEGSEKIFGKIFTYFLYLMIFASLAISVLTKDVLMLIADEKFWPAYKIVPLIVLATTIFSFQYHFNFGILISKKTKYLAYIDFSNGIFVLVMNFLLIPRYGIYGAAITTIFAFIYKVSLVYFISKRYYKIHFEFLRIAKIFITCVVLFTFTFFLHFESVIVSFTIKAAIISCYPFMLFSLKFYSQTEIEKIRKIFKHG